MTSLVKYNTPILVSGGAGKGGAPKKKAAGDRSTTQTEDILNSILPPREWTENGQLWIQYVSSTPATRLDVVNLQERLDQQMQQRQARETGICPIREELYAQCFDELIRQVTINCAERGLLLLRVRDEIRMTVAAYQTLYESSVAFGIRKALIAEQRRGELSRRIKQVRGETSALQQQVSDAEASIQSFLKRADDKRAAEEKAFDDELERVTRVNDALRSNLEAVLSAPKKNAKRLIISFPSRRKEQT